MKRKHHKINFVQITMTLMLVLMTTTTWAQSTAYVSTYAELRAAIENASVNNIIVTANIDVPCETSGNAGNTDLTGASTAQLIINRSLTLQSQAGSKYIIKRVAANGADATKLKSLIAIRGDGKGNSGTANLTENTVEVSFTNIIIDGGANWGATSVSDRYNAATDACGYSGRATIDVYLGATLNLEDGVEVRNGFTTKSDNSLLNDTGASMCFGGAIRVDYHNNTGGGTINIKAGATIHDCTARGGYGGALGAYNYARLNLYGGTIYNCSAANGGAIACTYRSAEGYGDSSAGTIRMYGGTISNCCASNGGALCTHGPVHDYVLGGTITSCSATYGGAIYQAFSTTVVHIVDHSSGKLTISDCTNTHETATANTDGYQYVYLSTGSISVTPVYQVTFKDYDGDFAVLSVVQGTSLGEAFPAAPAKAGLRFLGWYNGNTQVTSSTAITENITVTAKWEFYGSGTSAAPYQIPSTDAWNFLADNVNNGNTYSGKYFQLTSNISVRTMVGASTTDGTYKSFNGTFDGNGHTLNVAFSGSGQWTASFGSLNGATIKNLHITGSISTSEYRPASIAGFISGESTIDNCWSEVAISSSKKNYWVDAGGFVARVNNSNTLTLRGCLFTGSITYSDKDAYEGGGMVGWCQENATVNFYDCVFAPSAIDITKYQNQYTFAATYDNLNVKKTINNCYFNDVVGALVKTDTEAGFVPEGKHGHSITAGDNVTITNLGAATATYDVSGITTYSHGIKCNDAYYAGASESVSLNLGNTSHSGYSLTGYSVTAGTLTGSSNPYSLVMPAANVTINVRYSATTNIKPFSSGEDGWYLISSPIGIVNPTSVTNMLSNTYDIFQFNQSAELEWQNWEQTGASHNHFDLEPGRGYLYANSKDVDLSFIGTPYSGNGVVNLEYSTANLDSRMHGWNLIGNPFGVTANIGKAFYRMNAAHTEIIVASDNNILPMEGIFVRATSSGESVTFTTGAKRENASVEDRIVINLERNNGIVIDRAIVSFDKDQTLPKFQIRDNSTKLYIPQDGKEHAIAYSDMTGEMPLNFVANENGEYTLTVSPSLNSKFQILNLIDNLTGADIDLLATPSYTFNALTTDYASRFKLVFNTNENDGSTDSPQENEDFAFISNGQIIVNGEGMLQVIDMLGHQLISRQVSSDFRLPTSDFSAGMYVLQLVNGQYVKTQKIVIR